jgi:DNA-binding response OmpR family regulator
LLEPSDQNILVIDDETSFCEVVAEILLNDGYQVQKAFSASQALSILESFEPTLIILDIMMPDIDGLTMVRRLRSLPRFAHLPIIVSSAKFQEEDKREALEAGANHFLTKPFSAQELRNSIHLTLGNGSQQLST